MVDSSLKDRISPRGSSVTLNFTYDTYYTSAKGCLTDCSLRVEKVHPDSIDDLYIKTFPMVGKQMEI